MRARPSRYGFLAAALLLPALASADISVIVNPGNPAKAMTSKEVSDLYLGRGRTFPSGEYALAFDQPRESQLREKFFKSLSGMSLQQVNTYWSRLMFTGQMLPPTPLPDEKAVLDIVRRNPGAIGYVRTELVDSSVRAVLKLGD